MNSDFSFLDDAVFEPLRSQEGSNSKAFRTIAWDDKTPETNWIRVQYAYELMRDNLHGASVFPGAVAAIIRSRAWEGYEFRGKVIQASTFREFVEAKPPQGLGTTIDELMQLCKKYPSVIEGIDQVLREEAGKEKGNHSEDRPKNIEVRKSRGSSLQRSLRRLRNLASVDAKAAGLRNRVLRGDISANSALKELGKIKTRYSVDATPEGVASFARKHFTKNQIKKLIEALEE